MRLDIRALEELWELALYTTLCSEVVSAQLSPLFTLQAHGHCAVPLPSPTSALTSLRGLLALR